MINTLSIEADYYCSIFGRDATVKSGSNQFLYQFPIYFAYFIPPLGDNSELAIEFVKRWEGPVKIAYWSYQWQQKYGRPVSKEKVIEMIRNCSRGTPSPRLDTLQSMTLMAGADGVLYFNYPSTPE